MENARRLSVLIEHVCPKIIKKTIEIPPIIKYNPVVTKKIVITFSFTFAITVYVPFCACLRHVGSAMPEQLSYVRAYTIDVSLLFDIFCHNVSALVPFIQV